MKRSALLWLVLSLFFLPGALSAVAADDPTSDPVLERGSLAFWQATEGATRESARSSTSATGRSLREEAASSGLIRTQDDPADPGVLFSGMRAGSVDPANKSVNDETPTESGGTPAEGATLFGIPRIPVWAAFSASLLVVALGAGGWYWHWKRSLNIPKKRFLIIPHH